MQCSTGFEAIQTHVLEVVDVENCLVEDVLDQLCVGIGYDVIVEFQHIWRCVWYRITIAEIQIQDICPFQDVDGLVQYAVLCDEPISIVGDKCGVDVFDKWFYFYFAQEGAITFATKKYRVASCEFGNRMPQISW